MKRVKLLLTQVLPIEKGEPQEVTTEHVFEQMMDALEFLDHRVQSFTVFTKVELLPVLEGDFF